MDKYLISGSLALLFLQSFLLLSELGVLPDLYSNSTSVQKDRKTVGYIKSVRKSVKRRSEGDLIWQSGQQKENLFLNDSVLTLKESSTDLVIQEDIRLHLSENTLVVIEWPIQEKNQTLQFRFARGDLAARSQTKDLNIKAKSWTVNAPPKSEFQIRQIGNEDLEIEVENGSVSLKPPPSKGSQKNPPPLTIQKGQRAQLNSTGESSIRTTSQQLVWSNAKKQRIYTKNDSAEIQLSWQGPASTLTHWSALNQKTSSTQLSSGQTNLHLQLPRGRHIFYLERAKMTSKPLVVEVWEAPNIQYFSPLPRDRASTKEALQFHWARNPQISSYQLELIQPEDPLSQPLSFTSKSSSLEIPAPQRGNYLWKVIGYDPEGYPIPPSYNYPIYLIDNPLAAPKLRQPSSEKKESPSPTIEKQKSKANRGADNSNTPFWQIVFNALFPTAQAEELPPIQDFEEEITFQWFPVEGADYYVIEISSSRGFRQPEVIQKVKETKFSWKGFLKQTYYWRVAGGSHDGNLGLFSEPSTLNLNKVVPGELAPGVVYKVKVAPTKPALRKKVERRKEQIKTVEEKTEKATTEKVETAPTPKEFKKWRLGLAYQFINHFRTEESSNNLNVDLSGASPSSISAWLSLPQGEKERYLIQFHQSQVYWKPESTTQLPFQKELHATFRNYSLLYQSRSSSWAFGLIGIEEVQATRMTTETIDIAPWSAYGFLAQYHWWQNNWQGRHGFSISFGNNGRHYGIFNNFDFALYSLDRLNFIFGALIDFHLYEGATAPSGFHNQTGLKIGIEF